MKILLDAHIPSAVAGQLRSHHLDVETLPDWRAGAYRTQPDEEILAAAYAEQRVLVTYDAKTIRPLVAKLEKDKQPHAGVILVDDRTIDASDVGGLVRALRRFVEDHGEEDWKDRVDYLRRA